MDNCSSDCDIERTVVPESPISRSLGFFDDLWFDLGFTRKLILVDVLNNIPFSKAFCLRAVLSHLSRDEYAAIVDEFANLSKERFRFVLNILANARFDPLEEKIRWRPEVIPALVVDSSSSLRWNMLPHEDSLSIPVENACQDTIRLQKGFQSLPRELQCAIEDEFLISAFLPQKLFPVQLPSSWKTTFAACDHYKPPNLQALRALNRPQYTEYRDMFYSQNVWVIESGPASYALQFFMDLSEENLARIKRIELAFTIQDRECRKSLFLDIASGNAKFGSSIKRLHRARNRCDEEERLLVDIWWSKFSSISDLNLTHLTLDYHEAFNYYGEFIGVDFTNTLPRFQHGIPEHLEILAPSRFLVDSIMNIFTRNNP